MKKCIALRDKMVSRYWMLVIIALAMGFGLRFNWIMHFYNYPEDRVDFFDEYYNHVSTAENAFNGEGFISEFNKRRDLNEGGVSIKPPLQAVFLLAIFKTVGKIPDLIVPKTIQILISSLMILVCAEIGRRLVSPLTGILLAFCVALYPDFIYWSEILQTENNYLLGVSVIILMLFNWNRDYRPAKAFATALILGLITLQRSVTMLLGPWLGLFILPFLRINKKNIINSALVFVFAPTVVLLPWLVRNVLVYGEPVLTSSHGGQALYMSNRLNYDPLKMPYVYDAVMASKENDMLIPEIEEKYRVQDGTNYCLSTGLVSGSLTVSWYTYSNAYGKEALQYMVQHPSHFLKNVVLKAYNQFWLVQHKAMTAVLYWTLDSIGLLPQQVPLEKTYGALKLISYIIKRSVLLGGIAGLLVLLLWHRTRLFFLVFIIFLYYSSLQAVHGIGSSGRIGLYHNLCFIIFFCAGLDVLIARLRKHFLGRTSGTG